MGLIGKILEYIKVLKNGVNYSELRIDPGGGDNKNVQVYQPSNEESAPLSTDYAITVKLPNTGNQGAVGFIDPKNTKTMDPGEKKIYSRNSSGNIVANITLFKDGSLQIENDNGSFQMLVDGSFSINGLTIDASGNLETTGTIEGKGVTDSINPLGTVTLGTHTHSGTGTPPNPGT